MPGTCLAPSKEKKIKSLPAFPSSPWMPLGFGLLLFDKGLRTEKRPVAHARVACGRRPLRFDKLSIPGATLCDVLRKALLQKVRVHVDQVVLFAIRIDPIPAPRPVFRPAD